MEKLYNLFKDSNSKLEAVYYLQINLHYLHNTMTGIFDKNAIMYFLENWLFSQQL